jgi:hypothetical protein
MKEQPVITSSHQPSQPAAAGAAPRDGEPCASCGAPLAADQRYCLHCGTRRPEARLEFLDVLDADVRARGGAGVVEQTRTVVTAPPQGVNGRLQANSGLLGLGALLLLTLLIGLLVGHWVTDRRTTATPAAATPAPQVIRVEGGAASAPSSAAPATATATPSSSGARARTRTTARSTTARTPKGAVSAKSLTSKKALDDAVKKGKPISTGTGKLPPKDDKAAGGGSSFETIG